MQQVCSSTMVSNKWQRRNEREWFERSQPLTENKWTHAAAAAVVIAATVVAAVVHVVSPFFH